MNLAAAPKLIALVDLDDTLFNSQRKCAPGVALESAALLENGDTISYTSPKQRAMLAWLRQAELVVPVTARSAASFARVLLPFSGPAVVSFGGMILTVPGQVDTPWAQRMHTALAASSAMLHEACTALSHWIAQHQHDAWATLVEESGQTQYLLAKHRTADVQCLAQMRTQVLAPWAAQHPGWRVFQNDNNLSLLPPGLDKAHAVNYLLQNLRAQHGEIVTLGMGDSLSDAGFMHLCDYAMLPSGTQLAAHLAAGLW
jgi:hydroxymethylpyrimidine pyrophosphatase-like HAD family hydrolase